MKLTIKCPELEIGKYLQDIAQDLSEGYISGHSSQDKNWKIVEGESNE
jgi:hypothetical protein